VATSAPAIRDLAVRAAASHPIALAAMVRVPTPEGQRPLHLWRYQRALLERLADGQSPNVLKARQVGATQIMALFALWYAIRHADRLVLVLSIGDREATELTRRIRRMYQSLPQPVQRAFRVEQDNTEVFAIAHPEGPTHIRSLPAGAGRSFTASLLVCDEAAHWDRADERLADVLPTAGDAGQTIVASTAAGVGGAFYERYYAQASAQVFVGAAERPDRSPEWIAAARRELGHLGPQEYPLTPHEAFVSSGGCDFDTDALQRLLDEFASEPPWRGRIVFTSARTPRAERTGRGPWSIWEPPARGRTYLLAGDFSGGGASSDATAIVVYDAASWEQVACYHGRPNPDQAADQMAAAGMLYRSPDGPSLVVPEANNHGQAVVAHLLDAGYPRIYEPERFDVAMGGTRAGRSHGWLQNARSKPVAIAALQAGIREGTLGIRDAQAVGEMLRFSGGKAVTGHDDRVLSHAIAAAVLEHSFSGRPREVRLPSRPYWQPKDRQAGY
jgi:hypothetical protein